MSGPQKYCKVLEIEECLQQDGGEISEALGREQSEEVKPPDLHHS